jgi:hypothetical protein
MASTLRLPTGTSVRIVPSGSFITQSCTAGSYQCRPFSQTSQNLAGRPMNFRQPTQSQPSFKTRTKDMPMTQLPNDLGLLPGTFIKPLWRDMPSIFESPRDRLHMAQDPIHQLRQVSVPSKSNIYLKDMLCLSWRCAIGQTLHACNRHRQRTYFLTIVQSATIS